MIFNSKNCTILEILPKSVSANSTVTLKSQSNTQAQSAFRSLITFNIQKNESYTLIYEECDESFAYIYNPISVLNEGISLLRPVDKYTRNTYKESYHFTPPTGWLNDPNGLCFHGGVYHMYYQFYPHAQKWGNMHWGHAVSKDLVNWLHMPVFLTPSQCLLSDATRAGGAFSGSAIVDGEELRFFLTRHDAQIADESTMVEIQTTLTSTNGIKPINEIEIIKNINPAHSFHFRDPKVFVFNNVNYLVLGSAINGKAGVLLYSATDYFNWEDKGAVLQIENSQCVSVECPDMFELDGKFVCVAAQMCVHDECNRISPVHYYIGGFDGDAFSQESSGLYDFGANFYAVQSFEHKGRRIAIGWINDFYNEHKEVSGGVCGSMSLPRELSIKTNKLYMPPVKEVYSLIGDEIYSSSQQNISVNIEENYWYAKIIMYNDTTLDIVVARNNEHSLRFKASNGNCEIISTVFGGLVLKTSVKNLSKLEIFADGRTFEFFLNDGEAAGAKTFYCENTQGCFELNSNKQLESVKIYKMNKARS